MPLPNKKTDNSTRKADALAAIERGIEYRDREDYDRAVREFTEAIRLDPDNAAGYHNRGDIYVYNVVKKMHEVSRLELENPAYESEAIRFHPLEMAIRDFDTAIRLDPKNPESYLGRGAAYGAKRNHVMAAKDYKEALRLGLDPVTASGVRQLLVDLGSTNERYDHYANAVHQGAVLTSPQEYINLATACYHKKQFAAAVEHCTSAIKLDPNSMEAYFNRAEAYAQLNRYRDAINDYTETIRIAPDYDEACRGRGNAYTCIDEFDFAIESYTETIRINPDNSDAYSGRANAYAHKEQFDDALRDCMEAVRLDPENPYARRLRGAVYSSKEQLDEAIADFTEAVRLNPVFAEAYYHRGEVYAQRREHGLAINDFTRAIKLAPDYVDAYLMRGLSYSQLRRMDDAIKNMEKAHKLDPDDEEIIALLREFKTKTRF